MATNAATLISRITTELSQPVRRDMSVDVLNRRNELWVKLHDRLVQFAERDKAILANRTLSDEGKQQQQAKLAVELLADLAWYRRVLKDIEAAQARFKTVLFTVQSPVKDERRRDDRARELRDRMAGLNQTQRDAAYLKASQQDQPEVMWALLDAPGGSWISEEIQQRADTERAKHAQPDTYAAYTQNEILHEQVHSMADHLAMWLRSYGTSPATVATGLGLAA